MFRLGNGRNSVRGAAQCPLFRESGPLHESGWMIGWSSRRAQLRDDVRKVSDAHVEHYCLAGTGERSPVERIILEHVTRNERNTLREPAMRERDSSR